MTNGFCPCPEDIDIPFIEGLANTRLLNDLPVEICFMSYDVYGFFSKRMASYHYAGYSGSSMLSIWMSFGLIKVIPVSGYKNLCFVGTEDSFKALEWARVSKEFDDIFFGEQ